MVTGDRVKPNVYFYPPSLIQKIEKDKKTYHKMLVGLFVCLFSIPMYRIHCFSSSYTATFMADNADLPSTATFMHPFEWRSNIDFMVSSQQQLSSSSHAVPLSDSIYFYGSQYNMKYRRIACTGQWSLSCLFRIRIFNMYVISTRKPNLFIKC